MSKCAICTINSYNYGNRLQNYALQFFLNKLGVSSVTIRNLTFLNKKTSNFNYLLRFIKSLFVTTEFYDGKNRVKSYKMFDNNIIFSKSLFNWFFCKKFLDYDYYIVGSDQVWNPTYGRMSDFDLLTFSNSNLISYAASFGVDNIDRFITTDLIKKFDSFKFISVREDAGKRIINTFLPEKKVEVLIDPTMLLSGDEWDKVALKPKMLNNEKFILNYFLGELSEDKKKEIERIAIENNCEIINILDKNSPFYECGPSEFLWLEKHAFLICTDSFHSSVFAVLYNRPFIIFDREQEGMAKMNSRLDTLISKFNLKNRKFEGKITEENLNHDYSEAYKILEVERQKSKDFLERALDIKK